VVKSLPTRDRYHTLLALSERIKLLVRLLARRAPRARLQTASVRCNALNVSQVPTPTRLALPFVPFALEAHSPSPLLGSALPTAASALVVSFKVPLPHLLVILALLELIRTIPVLVLVFSATLVLLLRQARLLIVQSVRPASTQRFTEPSAAPTALLARLPTYPGLWSVRHAPLVGTSRL